MRNDGENKMTDELVALRHSWQLAKIEREIISIKKRLDELEVEK